MQIVIDIPEKRFQDIQRIATVQLKRRTPTLEQVIAIGIPLPKGRRKPKVSMRNEDTSTIIEADKAGEEE